MRYFLDTEFIENGPNCPVHLISVALVSEDGRMYYAEDVEAPLQLANDWVKANVLPQLDMVRFPGYNTSAYPREIIRQDILAFVGGDPKPEFWGYYSAYDWVVFAQIFGTMVDLPKGWPMYCRDIKQFCDSVGNPRLPAQPTGEHNALFDARWNREAYEFLAAMAVKSV